MNSTEVMEVSREALMVALKVGTPILVLALVVGLIIALFQALTHIQELTLTFVPKILVMFVALMALMPFMLTTMVTFGQSLMDRIVALG